jgi:hypothetical protein
MANDTPLNLPERHQIAKDSKRLPESQQVLDETMPASNGET